MKTKKTLPGNLSPVDQSGAKRDGYLISPWTNRKEPLKIDSKPSEVYDVVIIGAGITGVTTALMLQKAGEKCLLAEAHSIGFGTTAGTSAHINTFADTTYKEAESAFGKDGAQLFAEAINEGMDIIKANIKAHRISCDFENKKGYVFAENTDEVKQLEDLYEGVKAVGIDINYTENVPTPLPYKKAVVLEGQAQFHPINYLMALANAFVKAGGVILENTKINTLETDNKIHIATTDNLQIRAGKVIYATHIPPGITSFSFRCAPYRSYVLGIKLKGNNYPDALIYDMQEPYHYYRSHIIDGQQLLIAGGNDHKTGHEDPEKSFASLEKYIRRHYPVSSVKYKWSSQYYVPVDGFPYIGHMPEAADGVYCATGFNGNGMMLGTISAKILSDLAMGKANKYEKIFSPARIKPVAGFTEFVKENADVAYHFVTDRLTATETDSLKRLQPDTGGVVEIEGKKIAAYRDTEGTMHTLSPVCTHAACIVNWNAEEKSWDCPCHGARYDIDGKVLNGPASMDLKKIEIPEN